MISETSCSSNFQRTVFSFSKEVVSAEGRGSLEYVCNSTADPSLSPGFNSWSYVTLDKLLNSVIWTILFIIGYCEDSVRSICKHLYQKMFLADERSAIFFSKGPDTK